MPPALRSDSHEARAGALRARMTQRLDGARFRYLNEQLYSGTSSAAQRLFQEDPEAFLLYHQGFQKQMKKWPLQPVDQIARDLRRRWWGGGGAGHCKKRCGSFSRSDQTSVWPFPFHSQARIFGGGWLWLWGLPPSFKYSESCTLLWLGLSGSQGHCMWHGPGKLLYVASLCSP
jgi:hypothetical protein